MGVEFIASDKQRSIEGAVKSQGCSVDEVRRVLGNDNEAESFRAFDQFLQRGQAMAPQGSVNVNDSGEILMRQTRRHGSIGIQRSDLPGKAGDSKVTVEKRDLGKNRKDEQQKRNFLPPFQKFLVRGIRVSRRSAL
jgi:hypothetical protein